MGRGSVLVPSGGEGSRCLRVVYATSSPRSAFLLSFLQKPVPRLAEALPEVKAFSACSTRESGDRRMPSLLQNLRMGRAAEPAAKLV